jgi:hypothetical protein
MEHSSSRFSGPTPEVIYIPALFRRIQQGDIREPAFQRGFVWDENKIVELLKSIYQGFPIGSLLFWRVEDSILKVETPRFSVLPVIDEKYPCSFILDGLQRLCSLYAVFHYQPNIHDSKFRVFFNLDTNEFESIEEGETPPRSIPMWQLFSPKEFLKIQKQLNSYQDADALLEKAVDLHSRFQEYLVPTVTISGRSPSDVVQVFERVNSTALKLDAVDFMRAVTWSENFDLNSEIEGIAGPLMNEGFTIPAETVVKILAVTMGKEPTPESMLQLRTTSSSQLHDGVKRSRMSLERAIDFLKYNFHILSYEYVPYEGQLLALCRFFELCQSPSPQQLGALRSWYWTISFNEGLRGKPDHYVTRILHRIDRLVGGELDAFNVRLTITPTDFSERRFIRGKALSSAIAMMFAVRGARSLFNGQMIPVSDYMTEFVARNFQALLSTEELHLGGLETASNKVLANTFVLSSYEQNESKYISLTEYAPSISSRFGAEAKEICETQFITAEVLEALERADFGTFIERRAATMHEFASNLATGALG